MACFRLAGSGLTNFLQFHAHVKRLYGMGRAVRGLLNSIGELPSADYQ
jgi:hypothetical protein